MSSETLFRGANEARRALMHEASGLEEAPGLTSYVMLEMPKDLREVREGEMTYDALAKRHHDVLSNTREDITTNTDPLVAKATQLDLLFMLGAYLAKEGVYRTAPGSLLAAIHQQRDRFDITAHMDYDMIVDLNSAEASRYGGLLRVYSDGQFAGEEQDFYRGHSLAEPYAKDAAYQLRDIVDAPDLADIESSVQDVAENVTKFLGYMRAYSRLSRDAFGYFRDYIGTYPDGTRNASGAFMPSVQLLELALHSPTEFHTHYIDESMPYFPRWSQAVMQDWHSRSLAGENLIDKAEAGVLTFDPQTKEILAEVVVEDFILFRIAHLGITRAQITQAFEGAKKLSRKELMELQELPITPKTDEETGTGGFHIPNILQNGIVRLLVLQERLRRL